MRITCGRLASLVRAAAVVAVALGVATPAAAQFGGLKKKLKQAAGQEGANKAAGAAGATPETTQAADAAAPAGGGAAGGAVVLTDEVVKQLIDGLKAGRAEREAAAKEDTPYGRYRRQEVAYADAKPKCDAAQQAWYQRAGSDEKMLNKYSTLTEKMVAAQQKGDQKLSGIYFDSAMTMISPSCTVKQPTQPDKYYESQREVDSRAEQAEMKASRLSRGELYMAKERTELILRKADVPDISASEKSAVDAKAGELKSLMGIVEPARAAKPAPAPAPAPAPTGPAVAPGQNAMAECMMKNAKAHEDEIKALGERAEAAANAGNTPAAMAISDSLNQIQMAGCTAGR